MKLVLVAVGTDVHPFSRLVGWADQLAVDLAVEADVLVQHGETAAPTLAAGVDYLAFDELSAHLARADAVVCHGGPGSIMGARSAGHRPVVVPRDPRLGEHVDDHQQRFCDLLVAEDRADRADDYVTLRDLVRRALATGPRPLARVVGDTPPGVVATGQVLDELLARPTRRRFRR